MSIVQVVQAEVKEVEKFNALVLSAELKAGSYKMFAERCIKACGSHYGFNSEEAITMLNLSSLRLEGKKAIEKVVKEKVVKEKVVKEKVVKEKVVKEKVVKEKVVKEKVVKEKVVKEKVVKDKALSDVLMPYNGVEDVTKCSALCQNGALYTQCQGVKFQQCEGGASSYCKRCVTRMLKLGSEVPEYGTIQERMKVGIYEYVDVKGKKPIHYTHVMNRYKYDKDYVVSEALKLGMVLDKSHFEEQLDVVKRGRPSKHVKEDKTKGRPKKSAKVVELGGADLFETLMAEAALKASTASEALKASTASEALDEPLKELKVKKFVFEGKAYLRSKSTGVVYDFDSFTASPMDQKVVGMYVEASKSITFNKDESSSDESSSGEESDDSYE